MGPGGTDQLAHALGETRVSLGGNMVAVAQLQQPMRQGGQAPAVPAEDPSAEQDVVVFFGIIDILQVGPTPARCSASQSGSRVNCWEIHLGSCFILNSVLPPSGTSRQGPYLQCPET